MTDTKRIQPNQPNQPNRGQGNAHDRGRSDNERRNFSSDREADELGSELDRETDVDSEDEEDIDRPGRSNR
jgi:hypothetical protein